MPVGKFQAQSNVLPSLATFSKFDTDQIAKLWHKKKKTAIQRKDMNCGSIYQYLAPLVVGPINSTYHLYFDQFSLIGQCIGELLNPHQ